MDRLVESFSRGRLNFEYRLKRWLRVSKSVPCPCEEYVASLQNGGILGGLTKSTVTNLEPLKVLPAG
jgi:hypothetical protein